jgi:hypothetical protein
MKENLNSGYVAPVEDLAKILPRQYLSQFENIMSRTDLDCFELRDTVEAWLNLCQLNNDFTVPIVSIFTPCTEDTVDNIVMEQGKVYVVFDEGDLFTKTPTELMASLIKKGVLPEETEWSVWG